MFLSAVAVGLAVLSMAGCVHYASQREEDRKRECFANLATLNDSVICLGLDTNEVATINWANSREVCRHLTTLSDDQKTCPSGGKYEFRLLPNRGYADGGVLCVWCTRHGDPKNAQETVREATSASATSAVRKASQR
jgi:hypothetical protein